MSDAAIETAVKIFGQKEVERWDTFKQAGVLTLQPGEGAVFRTGFAQAIQEDYCCLLWDRSGMGGGKQVHRFAGVIDADYRGEWYVRLFNHSAVRVQFKPGDKIVQGIYQLRTDARFPVVEELQDSVRGQSGFGSTGS